MTNEPILQVRELEKTFGRSRFSRKKGFKALRGVTLEVGRGNIFGLLGPNGAGKTTLIKILLGLASGYEGEARIFGEPPGNPASRTRVGYLPETHRLPGYLTGRQVIRLFGMLCGRTKEFIEERMDPMLERVGMLQSAERKVRTYSKGMQQRIGLVQALVHEPEIVFLDEPTDGIDPVGRRVIREMVQELRDQGVTVFINSHLLMEVELICDRVVIMSKGQIIREGTVEELTPKTGAVTFELERTPEDLKQLVAGVGKGFTAEKNGFQVQVDDGEVNALIDRLRGKNIGIRAISPRRLSLEESFIDLVAEQAE